MKNSVYASNETDQEYKPRNFVIALVGVLLIIGALFQKQLSPIFQYFFFS